MEENEIEKLFLTTFTAFCENKNTQINIDINQIENILKYITFQILNQKKYNEDIYPFLLNVIVYADQHSIVLSDILMEYLINILCVLLLIYCEKEKQNESKNKPLIINTINYIIQNIFYILDKIECYCDILFKKIALVLFLSSYNSDQISGLPEKYDFILTENIISMMNVRQNFLDVFDDIKRNLFLLDNNNDNFEILYICDFNKTKVKNIQQKNKELIQLISDLFDVQKTEYIEFVRNQIAKYFRRELISDKRKQYDMKTFLYLLDKFFKEILVTTIEDQMKFSNILIQLLDYYGNTLTFEWNDVFAYFRNARKQFKGRLSDVNYDTFLLTVASLYSKNDYHGNTFDFNNEIIKEKDVDNDFHYHKLKLDMLLSSLETFNLNVHSRFRYFEKHIPPAYKYKKNEILNYFFEKISFFYRTYSDNDRCRDKMNALIQDYYLPFLDPLLEQSFNEDKSLDDCIYTKEWEQHLISILTYTKSVHLIDITFKVISKSEYFPMYFPYNIYYKLLETFIETFDYKKLNILITHLNSLFQNIIQDDLSDLEINTAIDKIILLLNKMNIAPDMFIYLNKNALLNKKGSLLSLNTSSQTNNIKQKNVLLEYNAIIEFFKKVLHDVQRKSIDKYKIWDFLNGKLLYNIDFYKNAVLDEVILMSRCELTKILDKSLHEAISMIDYIHNLNYLLLNIPNTGNVFSIEKDPHYHKTILTQLIETAKGILEKIEETKEIILINSMDIHWVMFKKIIQVSSDYISTMFYFYNDTKIIDGLYEDLSNIINNVFYKARKLLIDKSNDVINEIVLTMFNFISLNKDIIIIKHSLLIQTLFLLFTFSWNKKSKDFAKAFDKQYSKITNTHFSNEMFNLKNYLSANIQIACDYLIYYFLYKNKHENLNENMVSIFCKLFSRSIKIIKNRNVHKKVFKEIIKWSLIRNQLNHNCNNNNVSVDNNSNNVEYVFDKKKIISIVQDQTTKNQYNITLRTPFSYVSFSLQNQDNNTNINDSIYTTLTKPRLKETSDEMNELFYLQKIIKFKTMEEMKKDKNTLALITDINLNTINNKLNILDKIQLQRFYKVEITTFGNVSDQYNKNFDLFIQSFIQDNSSAETNKEQHITTFSYKNEIDDIQFIVTSELNKLNKNNKVEDNKTTNFNIEYQNVVLNFVKIVWIIHPYETPLKLIEQELKSNNTQKAFIVIYPYYDNYYHISTIYNVNINTSDYIKQRLKFMEKTILIYKGNNTNETLRNYLINLVIQIHIEVINILSYDKESNLINNPVYELKKYSEYDNIYRRYLYITKEIIMEK